MYLEISPQLHNIVLFIWHEWIVEGNSPKRKWIMGVCDLNYWLGRAEICRYLLHLNSQQNVSLFQPPPHREDRLGSFEENLFYDQTEAKHAVHEQAP